LVSRITGLVRELLIASTFGASALTDAFNVAFRIPNLFRRLFAEGAFSQAFVPVLAASTPASGGRSHTRTDSPGHDRFGLGLVCRQCCWVSWWRTLAGLGDGQWLAAVAARV
jgi:hypothetical protein